MATHSPQSGIVASRVNEIDNAVKTQIWIAISIYVLVAIVKRRSNLDHSSYSILQILSVTLMEKSPILQVLSHFNESEKMLDEAINYIPLTLGQ